MKKSILVLLLLVLVGCAKVAPEPEPQKPLNPASLTESERTEEIQRMLDQVGVQLPDNWEEMNKQERGKFLLPVLMQVDLAE